MLLSACVLTTPLALGGKHRNTVTKAHTELNPHHNQRAFYAHKLHVCLLRLRLYVNNLNMFAFIITTVMFSITVLYYYY